MTAKDPLRGRLALVTGGATGIGFATARALAGAGARVVIAGRDGGKGAAAVAELGGKSARFEAVDVSDPDSVASLFRNIESQEGRLDFLVNNAGVEGTTAPIENYPDDAWQQVIAVNLGGAFACTKHALPLMPSDGGGAVVNVASFVGTRVAVPVNAIYGAAKAGVVSLTAAAAAGYTVAGIRFHALCPWVTDTAMIERLTGGDPVARSEFASYNPSGRLVTPADIAGVAVRMLAGESGFESGRAYLVDAGGAVTPL